MDCLVECEPLCPIAQIDNAAIGKSHLLHKFLHGNIIPMGVTPEKANVVYFAFIFQALVEDSGGSAAFLCIVYCYPMDGGIVAACVPLAFVNAGIGWFWGEIKGGGGGDNAVLFQQVGVRTLNILPDGLLIRISVLPLVDTLQFKILLRLLDQIQNGGKVGDCGFSKISLHQDTPFQLGLIKMW